MNLAYVYHDENDKESLNSMGTLPPLLRMEKIPSYRVGQKHLFHLHKFICAYIQPCLVQLLSSSDVSLAQPLQVHTQTSLGDMFGLMICSKF